MLGQAGNTITILPEELVTAAYLQKEGGERQSLSHIKFLNFKKAMVAKVSSKEYGKGKFYQIVGAYKEQCGKK